jgi:hypothetical protein
MMNVLAYCDGQHDFTIELADRAQLPASCDRNLAAPDPAA